MKFKWEKIDYTEVKGEWLDCTLRAKVIGGWLVRHGGVSSYKSSEDFGYASEASMVFISDPNHKWKVK